ncbi:uncharacterized protein [Salminus brasiliensis]|uniref:uncharacterized protein n=1 Tax=Salminus brasiliensis TaxID=930266 RepID=UPI003B82ECC8
MEAGKTEKKRQELLFTDQFKKVKHTSQEHTGKVHSDMKNLKEMTAQMQTEQVQQTVDKSCYSFDKESSYDSTLKEEQEVSEEPQLYQKSIKSVTRSSELEKSALTAESTLPSETLPLSGNVEQSKKEKEEEKGVRQIAEKLDQGRVCDDDVRIQMHVLKEAGKMEKSGQELFSTEQVKNTSQQQAGKVHSDLKNLKEITDQIQNEQMEQPFDKWRYSFQKDFRYHMNKETQRTNLLLLQNALQNGQISVALYIKAEELLKNIHNANLKRLAFYLHKYMAFSALWQVRYQLNLKLCSARDHKEGQALKEFYVILTKLDKYEGVLLDRWKARQTAEKQESYFHFARITRMFNQLREAYGLNLLNPYPCQSYSLGKHSLPLITQERQRPVLLEQPNCNHPVKILNFLQTPRNNIAPPQGTREPNALKWSRIPNNVQLDKRLVVTATSVPITTRLQDRNINSSNASALRTVQSREPVRGAVPTVSKCPQTLNIVQLDMKLPVTPTPVPIIPHMLEMNINHSNASALRAVQSRIGESPVLLRRGKL